MRIENKKQQVILIILIPLFLAGLLYMRTKGSSLAKSGYESSILDVKEDKEIDKILEAKGAFNVKYEGGSRDPLEDLHQKHLYELQKEKPAEVELKIPLPPLNIKGLIWGGKMQQAIINGKVVGIGDNIEGAKIIKIERNGVAVEYQGETMFIPKEQKGE